MDTVDRVRKLVEPVLEADGTELLDVEYTGGSLRLTLDRPGGIDLDAVSDASQAISGLLDEHDPIPGVSYTLEVSSPGVERTLRTPEHFRRFLGTTVAVELLPTGNAAVDNERRLVGSLDSVSDDGVVIGGRSIVYVDIENAHTVFEWGPAPKQRKGNKNPKKASS